MFLAHAGKGSVLQVDNTREEALSGPIPRLGSFLIPFLVLVTYRPGRARYDVLLLEKYNQPGEILIRQENFIEIVHAI